MGHPFHPDDFPLNTDVILQPTKIFYLKGCIHFKQTAQILDLSGRVSSLFTGDFNHAWLDEAEQVARKLSQSSSPSYEIKSSGNMMRTLKTITDGSGGKVCDLNITFVSFGSSTVRFPKDSPHSRHEIELCPVGGRSSGEDSKHEAFVKNSIPYFWDMTRGRVGILYKCLNQKRVEIGRVAGYGFDKDAVIALNGNELDDVVAISTCIILLNGRDAMDA
ncbi:hypothetical protein F4781DRAFT_432745 [Annulohypoxylon bovei var. microspora]|nr:hypothetical protein F4781DRAFT_432745 [Annulohypoxylon bovei var. microspora]